MSRQRITSYTTHADPTFAQIGASGSLGIGFADDRPYWPSITIHCDRPELAADLAEAINAVLAKHAPKPLTLVEAA